MVKLQKRHTTEDFDNDDDDIITPEEPATNTPNTDDDEFDDEFDDTLNDNFGDYGDVRPTMEKHSELLRELMNFSPYLKTKFEKWVNIRWDPKDNKYVKNEYGEQIMNERGAHWCISFVDTYARGNNMVTYIDNEDYIYMKEDLIYAIWPNVYLKYREFGIRDAGNANRVCIEVFHTCCLVLMGSGGGKASNILVSTTHRTENVQLNPYQQQVQQQQLMQPVKKAGFLGKLKQSLGLGGR